jgi:hypothetical protein
VVVVAARPKTKQRVRGFQYLTKFLVSTDNPESSGDTCLNSSNVIVKNVDFWQSQVSRRRPFQWTTLKHLLHSITTYYSIFLHFCQGVFLAFPI